MQVIDGPNLIRVDLKLSAVSYMVLEDAEGKHVIFNRNYTSTTNDMSEPSSSLVTTKEANLAHRCMQKKCEDAFFLNKSNKNIMSALKKECFDDCKSRKG